MKEKFSCLGGQCINSCCGEFNGISSSLNSLEGRCFTDIILTPQDAKKLLASDYSKLVYHDKDGLYKVKTDKDGTCSAYRDGKCIINNIKPTVCKGYPLYLDMFIGLCVINDCISVKADCDFRCFLNEIEPMLDMYEFWINYLREKIKGMKS